MASAAQHDPLASARAHLARSRALREKTELHGKAVVRHLRRYADCSAKPRAAAAS